MRADPNPQLSYFHFLSQKICKFRFLTLTVLLGMVALIGYLYIPAINGVFMFDDYQNLAGLAEIHDLKSLLQFTFGGFSGPTGRPVSLLSFAPMHSYWPKEPAPFISVNIIIHLLNSVLVYHFIKRLLLINDRQSVTFSAGVVAFVWAISPNHVSTVAYIIQRMTLLSATFSLLALITLSQFLIAIKNNAKPDHKTLYYSALFTLTAVFCKENAALTVIIGLTLCYLLPFKTVKLSQINYYYLKRLRLVLGLSTGVLLIYLFSFILNADAAYQFRPFTLSERLLTESHLWIIHLSKFLFPRSVTNGVFQDNMTVVLTTSDYISAIITSLLIVLSSAYAIFRLRHYYCIYSFFYLFFIINHLIESTVIPLELYFEHRNYLPYIGLSAMLVLACFENFRKYHHITIGILIIFVVANLYALQQRTKLWGKPLIAASYWAESNPQSFRAQDNAAVQFSKAKMYYESLYYVRKLAKIEKSPFQSLRAANMACATGIKLKKKILLAQSFRKTAYNNSNYGILFESYTLLKSGKCTKYNNSELLEMVNATLDNKNYQKPISQQQFTHLKGLLLLQLKHFEQAIKSFKSSLLLDPTPKLLIEQATQLYSEHQCSSSLAYLKKYSGLDFRYSLNRHFLNIFYPPSDDFEMVTYLIEKKCLSSSLPDSKQPSDILPTKTS